MTTRAVRRGTTMYAEWRNRHHRHLLLREDLTPPEKILQQIWHHQRLRRRRLKTSDGKRLRILHPGFWNHEAGPDFKGAVLQFGDEPGKSGDVEVDLFPAGWRGHGHDRNPAFKRVILHVVWERPPASSSVPVLVLKPLLDAPLDELVQWLGSEAAQQWPENLSGKCRAPLKELDSETLIALLGEAASARLQRKAAEFQYRAREAGWEHALWEGLFRALGYKQNIWPMQSLAEALPDLTPAEPDHPLTLSLLQGRLLGVAGLLPTEIRPGVARPDRYLRLIWEHWWRERDRFVEWTLPRSAWRFNGVRPANHPQRRLALAAHWLLRKNFMGDLENWMVVSETKPSDCRRLLELLQVPRDDFWSYHWTFRSRSFEKPQPLLGAARLNDLAMNAILPWFWSRALAGKNKALQEQVEERYFSWPMAQDNTILRLAARRLLGAASSAISQTAAMQQGLLQIVRDFCDHSNAVCDQCPFPELVKTLGKRE